MSQDQTESPRLLGIILKIETEEDPILDYLGQFQDAPHDDVRTIDRKERGVMGRNEVRYFVAAAHHADAEPSTVEEAWERAEAYGEEWWDLRLKAVADVKAAGTVQHLETHPLGGIASDSDKDHFEQIAKGKLADLKDVLSAFGVSIPDDTEAEWATDAPVSGTVELP